MSDMLGIASGGIGAYQRALSTVSNNIANVNTEGYSRQDVVLQDSAPKKMASMYLGTGVMLDTIKRQYDAFAESNLRSSTSDLASQKPMVDYAKRVMDIMGDKSIGLSSAFDNFFAAAEALSADPASTVQRTSFLQASDGVASRFGELSSQLDLISTETRQGLSSAADKVNTLTAQLALINQSMTKSPTLEGQPAELLDRRDLTLRQLSELVRTKVSFSTNGSVTVSLGTTMTEGVVVAGIKSRPIGVNSTVKDKVELVLDPYGQTESLASISGGQIGGYQSFISQVLEPSQKNLSALAKTFVTEANNIQKNGIDGYGQVGQDLFAFAPGVTPEAAAIRVALSDGMRVSTAAQFRVSEGTTNVTTTKASVKYTGQTPTTALSNSKLLNNPNKTAGVTFKVDGAATFSTVTTLSAGVKATFYLDDAEPGQQLQVLTRDGRQLLGQALTETEKYQLLKPANGFAANANYSDAYLNKTGVDAYRDLNLFYGAKATVQYPQNFDQNGAVGDKLPTSAVLESGRISSADFGVAAGAFVLNKVSLGEFVPDSKTSITITGLNVSSAAQTFNFNAIVGDRSVHVSSTATQDLASLAADLKNKLEPEGLSVALINNGQDLQITDAEGHDISGVTLTPVTQGVLTGIDFGTGSSAGFSTFAATIGGTDFRVDLSTAVSSQDAVDLIQKSLRAADQQSAGALTVSLVNGGSDIQISDALGRRLSDVQLAVKDSSSSASGGAYAETYTLIASGSVNVTSPAEQMARWMNGVSAAQVIAPTFGDTTPTSLYAGKNFKQFSISLNGVSYRVDLSQSTLKNTKDLAAALQTKLRELDQSADITVSAEADKFKVTDAAGRKITDVTLVPKDGSDATAGAVKIDNSTLSQTDVRAEVFSEVRVPVSQLQLSKKLIINGQEITGYKNVQDLVKAINQSPAGLHASVVSGGELVIENSQGGAIHINSTTDGNALNVQPGTYNAQIRMTQVVRDMRVPSSGVDYKKPLQINGVNLSESVYSLNSSSASFQVDFGYPVQSVSGADAETLVKALNSRATISGIAFPTASTVAFSDFSISVAGKDIHLSGLTSTSLAGLASELQTQLRANTDAGAGVNVVVDSAGQLVFSDDAGRALVPGGLTLSSAGATAQAQVGQVLPVMSQSYKADLDAQGRLRIAAIDASVSDAEIADMFTVKDTSATVPSTLLPQTTMHSMNDLIARINSRTLDEVVNGVVVNKGSGVVATLDENGDIKLSTTDARGTRNISIGPGKDATGQYAQNALGVEPLDYDVSSRLKSLLSAEPYKSDIRLTFGSYTDGSVQKSGDPALLAKIGFRTGAYVEGGSPDDLLLFVTGKGSANVSVGYSGQPDNIRDSLRSQSLQVKFTASDRYTIVDANTGTELADRQYDPSVLEPVIDFEGLQIKLSHAPSVGDSYTIDGNYDGLGNNVNILDMASLSKTPVSNGKTISNTYIDQINTVGNLAEQANITQQALTVVNDQAIASRDKVSGVNLDNEAAALIRYQQAYQACAKALKISGELFDTINQIN